jgi:type IV pilus assembly protein PilV
MVKKQKGFSLIEVLIGLILLAIGVLALAGLQASAVRGNFFSNNLTQASYVGQDRLEYLKNIALTHADLTAGTHNDGTTTIAGMVFSRSYTVVVNGGLRTINYTVTWFDGVSHTITFTTIRSI